MTGGCSSLVVVETRSPRFNSVGVTARFEFHLVAFNKLHSVREGRVHGWSRTCRSSICLPKNILQLPNISRFSL